MIARLSFTSVLLFMLANAVFTTSYASPGEARSKGEDSAVLRAALNPLVASAGEKYFVVSTEPHAAGLERDWIATHLTTANKADLVASIDQIVTDYERRNAKEQLPENLDGNSLKFVAAQTLTKIFAGDVIGGWKRFRTKFPDAAGLLDLSLPGYSLDGMHSIVCYSVSRGSLSGEVWVALLSRKKGSWVVEWREILVQS